MFFIIKANAQVTSHCQLCFFTGGGPGEVSNLDLRPYHRPLGCEGAHEFSKMEPQDCGQFS